MEKGVRRFSLCSIILVALVASVALGGTTVVGLVPPPPPPPSIDDVIVTADPVWLPANGMSQSLITATVINGTPGADITVYFSIKSQPGGAVLTNTSYVIRSYSGANSNAYTELIAGVVVGKVTIEANCLGIKDTTHVDLVSEPKITNWYNDKTQNSALLLTINESECVYFSATADQPIDTWRWFVDGVNQAHNFNEFTYCGWAVNGTYKVKVNGTSAGTGDSNTVTWTVTVNDVMHPAQVTGLTNGTPTFTTVDLWWTANAEPDLIGYKVYQDGGLLATTAMPYYNVTGLAIDTTYTFDVSAYDDNGLEGAPATLIVTTPAYSAPIIIDWYNNETQDNALLVTIFESDCIYFNATADQPIDTWQWFVDGVDQAQNNDEFTNCWIVASDHVVAVNGTNANGTTNTVTWTVRVAPEDTEAPTVTNPNADPSSVPEDTDNEPLWGELTELSVVVTDASVITSVTIDLSSLGGNAAQPMTQVGASDVWTVSTNASIGTAGWNGSAYVSYLLQVTATDEYAQSNSSVSIELLVMKNGDVNEDGSVNFADVTYLANHVVGTPGFDGSLKQNLAEVNGDSSVNFADVTYLANHVVGTSGFELLK